MSATITLFLFLVISVTSFIVSLLARPPRKKYFQAIALLTALAFALGFLLIAVHLGTET